MRRPILNAWPVLAIVVGICVSVGGAPANLTDGTGKESPKYKIIGGGKEYEIRKYKPGTWIKTEVTGIGFDGAVFLGPKALVQYFKGANEEGVQLNLTTPLFLDFYPTVGEGGAMNGTSKSFLANFILPKAFWDDAPKPTAPTGFPTPEIISVPKFYSYAKKFAGYAFETEVLKLATALNATLAEDGVDLAAGQWTYAKYDGKFLEDHNEILFSSLTKPPKHLLTLSADDDDGDDLEASQHTLVPKVPLHTGLGTCWLRLIARLRQLGRANM